MPQLGMPFNIPLKSSLHHPFLLPYHPIAFTFNIPLKSSRSGDKEDEP